MNDQRYDDLTGRRFGRLVALRYIRGVNGAKWECECDCGNITIPTRNVLVRGTTTSCGCFAKENVTRQMTKHGMSYTKEYKAWCGMIERCEGSEREVYVRRYQERGIAVCDEWRHDFQAFLDHIGPAPSRRHSVDRIKNDRGYEPGNVRWATAKEQANNRG